MVNKKVTIAVDRNFFDTKFEKERLKVQKKLGLINLSQPDFSKMIKGFKIKLKDNISKPIKRGKINAKFKI